MTTRRRALVSIAKEPIAEDSISEAPISEFSIIPLQPSLGAEVRGIDLRRPLTTELRRTLHAALLRHRVLFFRDQALTREQHIAFGRAWPKTLRRRN